MLKSAFFRVCRAFLDDAGSATIEFVVAVPLLVGMATVGSELGGALRVNAVMESAVRDAARILSITPRDPQGDLLAAGVDRAFALVAERLRESGGDVTLAPVSGPDLICADGGSPCLRLTAVPGSRAVFGRDRYQVTVLAAVKVGVPLLMIFSDNVVRREMDSVVMYAESSQLLFD